MKTLRFYLWVFGCCGLLSDQMLMAQEPEATLRLDEAIHLAHVQSIAAKQALTLRQNKYWAWRTIQSNYKPQLLLTTRVPAFTRSVEEIQQPNGSIDFQPVKNNNSSASLLLSQSITATGGTVYIGAGLQRFDDFERSFTLYNGSLFSLGFEQPLWGFNQLKWDKQIEPLKYTESIRQYTVDMEVMGIQVTDYFFDLLLAQSDQSIARTNLAVNDTLYRIARERFQLGKISRNDLLQLELEGLKSRKALAAANQATESAMRKLQSYLSLRDTGELQLVLPVVEHPLRVDGQKALAEALANRPDAVAFQRRLQEADRDLARARGESGLNATLAMSVGLSNRGANIGDLYHEPQDKEIIALELSVPVLDWGRRRSQIETARAGQQFTQYSITQERSDFEREILTQVTLLHMLGDQLELTAKADRIALERYQIAKDRYILGDLNVTDLSIALQEKDLARRDYILSLYQYWRAVHSLRTMTLFDFEKMQTIHY